MKELTKNNTDLDNIKISDLFDIKQTDKGIMLSIKKHVIIDTGENHLLVRGKGVGILDFKLLHFNPFYKNKNKADKLDNPEDVVQLAKEIMDNNNKSNIKSKTSILDKVKFFIINKLKWSGV